MQLDTHLKQIIYRSKAPLAALALLHLLVVWMLWSLLAWILVTITATKQINYTYTMLDKTIKSTLFADNLRKWKTYKIRETHLGFRWQEQWSELQSLWFHPHSGWIVNSCPLPPLHSLFPSCLNCPLANSMTHTVYDHCDILSTTHLLQFLQWRH